MRFVHVYFVPHIFPNTCSIFSQNLPFCVTFCTLPCTFTMPAICCLPRPLQFSLFPLCVNLLFFCVRLCVACRAAPCRVEVTICALCAAHRTGAHFCFLHYLRALHTGLLCCVRCTCLLCVIMRDVSLPCRSALPAVMIDDDDGGGRKMHCLRLCFAGRHAVCLAAAICTLLCFPVCFTFAALAIACAFCARDCAALETLRLPLRFLCALRGVAL